MPIQRERECQSNLKNFYMSWGFFKPHIVSLYPENVQFPWSLPIPVLWGDRIQWTVRYDGGCFFLFLFHSIVLSRFFINSSQNGGLKYFGMQFCPPYTVKFIYDGR